MKINLYESITILIPLSGLALATYFLSTSKKVLKFSDYNKKSTNSITKEFAFSHVIFHNWATSATNRTIGMDIGTYATLISSKSLNLEAINNLKALFDVVEIDESTASKIYTLEKFKII